MGTTQDHNNMERVDIVIKVDELLDEKNRYRFECYLLKAAGINRVKFDKFRQQILIIGYDPAQIDSSTILEHIKQQRLNPQLIVGI
jgi:precorrin isomerase